MSVLQVPNTGTMRLFPPDKGPASTLGLAEHGLTQKLLTLNLLQYYNCVPSTKAASLTWHN